MKTVYDFVLSVSLDKADVSLVMFIYIAVYYALSIIYVHAEKSKKQSGFWKLWKKNGLLDKITTLAWVVVAIILFRSLFELSLTWKLSIGYLVLYYIYFIFLFAFLYGLLQWHYPGQLDNVQESTYRAEWQYLLISIQTQTTLGYGAARPVKFSAELMSCVQALLGLFFCVLFIAVAVSKEVPSIP